MDIYEAVIEGRAEAEAIMTDIVQVTRKSEHPVTDPETHKVTYPTVVIYPLEGDVGRARVQSRDIDGQDFNDAGASLMVTAFQAQLPVRVPLQKDDLIEVVSSASDPLMVGRVFRADSVIRKTHATKIRANVEEVLA